MRREVLFGEMPSLGRFSQTFFCGADRPQWGAKLEAFLKANNEGKGYFVGDKLSYADIAVYNMLWVGACVGVAF